MEARQRTGLRLNFVGIEIGGTKLQLVLGDEAATIQERRKFIIERNRGAAGIRKQIEQALPALINHRSIAAIGVGFGGPVDWRDGRICRSHQIEGWSEFDLGGWLQQLTGAGALVDNDGNIAALGEARHGAGVNSNPVFYVTLGSGVGGGLVVDGKIYHGATPGEAEIGHLRLDRGGTIVEKRCSGWAVDAKIRDLKTKEPGSLLSRLAGQADGGEAKHLTAALQQGDAAAQRIVEETAEDLAFALSHVVHLFHPEIIVIGGGLSHVGEILRTAVQKNLARFTMDAFVPGPRVALSALC